MDQHPIVSEETHKCVSLNSFEESNVDLAKVCWMQLLRETPEMVTPQRPSETLPEHFLAKRLYL